MCQLKMVKTSAKLADIPIILEYFTLSYNLH